MSGESGEASLEPGSRVWLRLSQGQYEIIKVAAGTGQGQVGPQEPTDAQGLQAFSLTPKCAHHPAHCALCVRR